jgi:hypothetical protein
MKLVGRHVDSGGSDGWKSTVRGMVAPGDGLCSGN